MYRPKSSTFLTPSPPTTEREQEDNAFDLKFLILHIFPCMGITLVLKDYGLVATSWLNGKKKIPAWGTPKSMKRALGRQEAPMLPRALPHVRGKRRRETHVYVYMYFHIMYVYIRMTSLEGWVECIVPSECIGPKAPLS